MIADKFSKDAKVKLTLFQKIGQKRFGVHAIVSKLTMAWTPKRFCPIFFFDFIPKNRAKTFRRLRHRQFTDDGVDAETFLPDFLE